MAFQKTSAAQRQELAQVSTRQEIIHEFLKDFDYADMLTAVCAHIEARPETENNAQALTNFGNRCNSLAWPHLQEQ